MNVISFEEPQEYIRGHVIIGNKYELIYNGLPKMIDSSELQLDLINMFQGTNKSSSKLLPVLKKIPFDSLGPGRQEAIYIA